MDAWFLSEATVAHLPCDLVAVCAPGAARRVYPDAFPRPGNLRSIASPKAPSRSRRGRAADRAGGRKAPLRIKKIAERRTIWGGGRLRRKRGAEDHGDGREQPQERGARRLDRLHLPGWSGSSAAKAGPGAWPTSLTDDNWAPRLARALEDDAAPRGT